MGTIGVAFAQTHRVQFVEFGTELPIVVEVTCNEATQTSGLDGYLELDVACETIYIHSPYHHRIEYDASDFLNMKVIFLTSLKQQETVIIEEKRSPAHAQSYGLDTQDLERTPGGFDDPIRLIQSLPGAVGYQRVWTQCWFCYFARCGAYGKSFVY